MDERIGKARTGPRYQVMDDQLELCFDQTKSIDEMIRILKVALANLSIAKMNMDFLLSIHYN